MTVKRLRREMDCAELAAWVAFVQVEVEQGRDPWTGAMLPKF